MSKKSTIIIISIFLFLIISPFLLLNAFISIYYSDSYTYTEPYIYPVPDNYDSLSLEEQKAVYSIPEDIANDMSTEALLESILSNPFISDMYIPMGMDDVTYSKIVKANEERFRIVEFLNRLDSYEVLKSTYYSYCEDITLKEQELGGNIKYTYKEEDLGIFSYQIQGLSEEELTKGHIELLDLLEKSKFIVDLKMFGPSIIYGSFTYYYNIYFVQDTDQW